MDENKLKVILSVQCEGIDARKFDINSFSKTFWELGKIEHSIGNNFSNELVKLTEICELLSNCVLVDESNFNGSRQGILYIFTLEKPVENVEISLIREN